MSERIDRRIGNNNLLLVIIIIFAIASAAGLFAWQRLRVSSVAEPSVQAEAPGLAAGADEPLSFMVYYPVEGALVSGPVPVSRKPDTQSQARDVLLTVLGGPRAAVSPVFSQIKLRELFLDEAGTAYADLVADSPNGVQASGLEELMAIYAMVDTLTQNFEEIKQVRFLIDGREAQTLAGHIDLSRTFARRMDLVKQ